MKTILKTITSFLVLNFVLFLGAGNLYALMDISNGEVVVYVDDGTDEGQIASPENVSGGLSWVTDAYTGSSSSVSSVVMDSLPDQQPIVIYSDSADLVMPTDSISADISTTENIPQPVSNPVPQSAPQGNLGMDALLQLPLPEYRIPEVPITVPDRLPEEEGYRPPMPLPLQPVALANIDPSATSPVPANMPSLEGPVVENMPQAPIVPTYQPPEVPVNIPDRLPETEISTPANVPAVLANLPVENVNTPQVASAYPPEQVSCDTAAAPEFVPRQPLSDYSHLSPERLQHPSAIPREPPRVALGMFNTYEAPSMRKSESLYYFNRMIQNMSPEDRASVAYYANYSAENRDRLPFSTQYHLGIRNDQQSMQANPNNRYIDRHIGGMVSQMTHKRYEQEAGRPLPYVWGNLWDDTVMKGDKSLN